MKKDLYNAMITLAHEEELAGVLHVAVFDSDITPVEFLELTERVNTIKKKCEEIGK